MLDKTTELFDQIKTGVHVKRESEMYQLGVSYRGSSIIGDDDIRGTTLKVSGYNKDSETAACPGDRAPEVPSLLNANGGHKPETLFGIFSPSSHTVLVFAQKYDESSGLALSNVINRLPKKTVRSVLILPYELNGNELGAVYDDIFVDCGGHAHASYGFSSERSCFVVVRPDGVIGTRVHEVAGVERYFQKIFS